MNRSALVLFLIACLTPGVLATDGGLPAKEAFHLFLLVGQSNMAGRGVVEEVDRVAHPRVLTLTQAGKWVPAVDPIHFDKVAAGVGLGKTFGEVVAEARPGVRIGLIPCAVGGSPIDTWQPGVFDEATRSYPWDDMMRRIQVALPAGTLKGILWHQGESDSKPELASSYEAKLQALIARFRVATEAPTVPFIVGQMGRFGGKPWTPEHGLVDQVHQTLPNQVLHTAFVSSEGLQHKGDQIHFDAASYREFGKRYAEVYLKMSRVP
jgi:hypothetical protein